MRLTSRGLGMLVPYMLPDDIDGLYGIACGRSPECIEGCIYVADCCR